jgi:hypothetical protein
MSKKPVCKQVERRPDFTLVFCLTYFFNVKMEAICSSETPVETQRATRRYIPEDVVLFNIRDDFYAKLFEDDVPSACLNGTTTLTISS